MTESVFLSAGVPDPKRGPEYAATSDTVAITAAVSALLHVTLGRRELVWGGHPAITPMIWIVAQEVGVDYSAWVRLYQSRFFQDEFPEDNERFHNVTYVEQVAQDRQESLLAMRESMFLDNSFTSAVFIGGMGGILDEFELFRKLQPNAQVLPVVSTGGASIIVAERLGSVASDLRSDMDYIGVFHRHLGFSFREERFRTPKEQPIVDCA